MIVAPTPSQLLRTIRATLDQHVAPCLTEPAAAAALAQVNLVMRYLEAVVDHELAWMLEEIADIHDAAAAIVDAGDDSDGRIAQALRRSQRADTGSLELMAARDRYQLASEVLSCCLDAGQSANVRAIGVLRDRLDREEAIKAGAGLVFASRVAQDD